MKRFIPSVFTRQPRLDIPFTRDDANLYLPWIISFMVFLTALFLAAGITLNTAITESRAAYGTSFTVEVPYQSAKMEDAVKRALDIVQATEGVKSATLLERAELKKLVAPWLGEGAALDMLPMPAIIEARVERNWQGRVDMNALRSRLEAVTKNTVVDDNKQWIENFARFTRTIQWIAYSLAMLLVVTTTGIIVLTARTALKLHQRTVELLHFIGARDGYIARQFQINAFYLALRGATAGTIVAALTFGLIGWLASKLEAAMMPPVSFSAPHLMMMIALPLLTGVVALIAARITVQGALGRMV